MTFANGREDLIKTFENWPIDRVIPELYSVPFKKLPKEYYVVGGMPEAVKTWIETHDFEAVEEVQNEILHDYADDFSKHAPLIEVPKIRWIWDAVPVQLAKENELIPVEVKAADNTQAKSFKQFCKKYAPRTGFKLSEKNIAENTCEGTRAFSVPLYLCWKMLGFL